MTTRGWLAPYLVLTLVWGSSFLFIEVGLEALTPGQVAFSRVALGAVVLLGYLAVRRTWLPRGWRTWRHLVLVGLTFSAIPFLLFAWAQTQISSILAGIWNATTPLWAVLMGLLLVPSVRPTRSVVGGLALGFFGVVVVLGPWSALDDTLDSGLLLGTAACLGATACYGFSVTYMGKHLVGSGAARHPVQYPAAQLLVATAALAVVVLPSGDAPTSVPAPALLAMLGLGVLGTGFAYVLLYRVVSLAGATTASTVTYLIPLVSTALGVAVLGEALTWNEPVGAALVLAGAWLTRPRAAPVRSTPLPRTEEPRPA
jgi:drug/metabolite transporter (DMT)-like permease